MGKLAHVCVCERGVCVRERCLCVCVREGKKIKLMRKGEAVFGPRVVCLALFFISFPSVEVSLLKAAGLP